MTTTEELIDYLNLVAEYERLPSSVAFTGYQLDTNMSLVKVSGEEYLVDTAWAMGNAQRLPDRCTKYQMIDALTVSHPDVKQAGPKNEER